MCLRKRISQPSRLGYKNQDCAEARVAYLACSTGLQEWMLGMIVGHYRRLVSKTAVKAQAMRLQEEMRRDRRAEWMASLAGPGWARRGNCHRFH